MDHNLVGEASPGNKSSSKPKLRCLSGKKISWDMSRQIWRINEVKIINKLGMSKEIFAKIKLKPVTLVS